MPDIVSNSIGYYSGFAKAKKLSEAKINSIKVSADEYHLEIRYPLERPRFMVAAILPAIIAATAYAGVWAASASIWSAVSWATTTGAIAVLWSFYQRSKELSEAVGQSEETLNRLDVQYRTLIDTKMSLQRKLDESQAINELTNSLIRTSSEDEILQSATENLTRILAFDRVLIMLHDSDKKFLEVRANSAINSDLENTFKNFRLPIDIESDDPSKVSNIYRSGNPVLIQDVGKHILSLNPESQLLLQKTGSKSFACVPIRSSGNSHGVILTDTFITERVLSQDDLSLLSLAGRQIAIALEKQAAQNEAVEAYIELGNQAKSYSRFVPFESIKMLGFNSVQDVQMGAGREIYMAIVFCDIRGFTSMAEQMSPTDSMSFLNSYFSNLAPVFHKNHGMIDKFLGDGIMALFLDPRDAIKASAEFQSALEKYNIEHRTGGNRNLIKTGMGIHFGKVLLGAVGFEDRLSISVVSDAVNLTSRLDGLTKKYGVDIVVSEEAYLKTNDPDNFRIIAELKVEGRVGMTKIYEYFGHQAEKIKEYKRRNQGLISDVVRSGKIMQLSVDHCEDPVVKYYQNLSKLDAA